MKACIPPQSLTIIPQNLERLPKLLQADQKLAESGIQVTWELLALIEPRLPELLKEFGPFFSWEDEAQAAVAFQDLVGYQRQDLHPILCTGQAYEVAYTKFYGRDLPAD